MSYSVKKAGVPFKAKLGTNSDLSGQADNFEAYYINDATGVKTEITNPFVEDANTAGLYMVEITIPAKGDYTLVIKNDEIGMGNHEKPIVIVNADIDDVKDAIDSLTSTVNTIAGDVDGLNGQNLQDIKNSLSDISLLIDNSKDKTLQFQGDVTGELVQDDNVTGDTSGATGVVNTSTYDNASDKTTVTLLEVEGEFVIGETVTGTGTTATGILGVSSTTIDSIKEFVQDIQETVKDGSTENISTKLDDLIAIATGSEYLSDGVTENIYYDENNPGLAKESTLVTGIQSIKDDIANSQAAIETAISDAKTAIETKIDATKLVVDANKAYLEDAGYGLSALKDLIDSTKTAVQDGETNITSILNDATNGLEAIKNTLLGRFDNVDAKLLEIENKVDADSSAIEYRVIV